MTFAARGAHPKVAGGRLGRSKIGLPSTCLAASCGNMQARAAAIVDGAVRAALNKRETKG